MDSLAPLAAGLASRYRIDREIGRGGMATVYLARDLRHDRPVALKVLNPELAAVLGAERFLSEIRVTANLQHPNLLPLFDSGEVDGLLFYVMPYVEGESLRARIDREKQLPIDEAVHIAAAVAGALDHAHRHGVIHRDLKPENILLNDGQPLVADFGIALAVSNAGGARVTATGLSLGTPQYMSPEQATGDRNIDGRTDIYSLGAVAYEMLTGEPPHSGTTAQAIIARLMTEAPRPVSAARKAVPPHVESAILCALEKLPADRFTHARDFADALQGKHVVPLPATAATATARPVRGRLQSPVVAWSIAALALIAATTLIFRDRTNRRTDSRLSLSTITEPGSGNRQRIAVEQGFALSPDGSRVAYVVEKSGVYSLWVRALDTLSGIELPATDGARLPFWSPDGTRLGYFAGFNLHVRTLATGDDRTLCPAPFAEGGSWGADDIIVYAPELRGPIHAVKADGGECSAITTLAGNQLDHRRPTFLPDGRHFIYGSGSGSAVFVSDPRTKEQRLVRPDLHYATFANGYLLYVKDRSLFAQPFDADELTITGEPRRILDGVGTDLGGRPLVAANATTLLVATVPSSANTIRRVSIPPVGSAESTVVIDAPVDVRGLALSHDGNMLAVGTPTALYIYDTERGTRSRVSADTNPQFGLVAWSRDDSLLAYNHVGGSDLGIRLVDVRRDTAWSLLPSPQNFTGPLDWSPDGATLLFATAGASGTNSISLMNVATRTVRPLVQKTAAFSGASLSPDGRWLAYGSAESGPQEIYILPVASHGPTFPVTRDGGISPQWRGNEIFYVAPTRGVVAVTVTLGSRPRFSEPRYIIRDPQFRMITLSRDARELYGWHGTSERMLTVVQNWTVKATH